MRSNIGIIDKRIRIGAGALFLLISLIIVKFYFLAAIIGVYGLLTGLSGWCPVYQLFGLNTFGSNKKPGEKG